MTITVKELRLSLVWSKAFAKAEFMPYLADSHRYKSEFKRAREQKGDWLLPWQPGEWQHFWEYYLHTSESGDLDTVNANTAWENLVPLRAPTWAQVGNLPTAVKRVGLEGFCFPYSVGVIATVFLPFDNPLSLEDAVQLAVQARQYQMYGVTWQDNGTKSHGSLHSLANELIDKLHARVLGGTPRGLPLKEPITIATVIDAAGAWAPGSSSESSALHRALYGLCVLEPGWQEGSMKKLVNYPDLDEPDLDRLTDKRRYALERGRAVWSPQHFSDVPAADRVGPFTSRIRKLGCYHRNLSLAALQTRGLIHLTRRAQEFLDEKSPISLLISNSVKHAVENLNDLYAGGMLTYQSWSNYHHIDSNLDMLKQVAAKVNVNWIGANFDRENESDSG